MFGQKIKERKKELSKNIFEYKESSAGGIIITGLKRNERVSHLEIPDNIDRQPVTHIDANAFTDNETIKSVNIGKNVRFLGSGAFWGCTNLNNVSYSKLTDIASRCFAECTSLSYFDFTNVETVNSSAFAESGLKKVIIPSSVKDVKTYAFKCCEELTMVFWSNEHDIPFRCFFNCKNLKTVILSDQIKNIECHAFDACPNAEFTFV